MIAHFEPKKGDYIGSNVNIASRLAEEAHRHQFIVTDEVRRRAKSYEAAEFVRIGRKRHERDRGARTNQRYCRDAQGKRFPPHSSPVRSYGQREHGTQGAP